MEIDWVKIPEGEFLMGLSKVQAGRLVEEADRFNLNIDEVLEHETPWRKIDVGTFYISRFPVTNTQFVEVMRPFYDDNLMSRRPYVRAILDSLRPYTRDEEANHPAYSIWPMAWLFCTQIGARLPSSIEWEKAARGTEGRLYPWGDEWDVNRGNFGQRDARGAIRIGDARIGYGIPVGLYPEGASPYGVHDMAGSGDEWTMTHQAYRIRRGKRYTLHALVVRGSSPKEGPDPWKHRVTRIGYGDTYRPGDPYTTFRPVLDVWQRRIWTGLRSEQSEGEMEKVRPDDVLDNDPPPPVIHL